MKDQFLGIILIALAVFLIGVPAFAEYQIGTCNVGTLYANATTIYYGELYVKLGANWVKSSPRKMGVCANNGGTNVLACSANADMMSSYNKAYYTLTGTSKANFIMAPGSAITCGDSYKIYPWPTDWIGYMHLYGGDGNDYLFGSPHGDGIHGGSGTNYFYPMGGQATDPYGADLYGSIHDDYYYIAANDIIHQITDEGGNNRVEMDGTWSSQAENGITLNTFTTGNNLVFGGIYDDMIEIIGYGIQTVFGDEGDDEIIAINSTGDFYGGLGSDFIHVGRAGSEEGGIICTGPDCPEYPYTDDADCIEDEMSTDTVIVESYFSILGCDQADDVDCDYATSNTANWGCHADLMGGNDTYTGGPWMDFAYMGDGTDHVYPGGGSDYVYLTNSADDCSHGHIEDGMNSGTLLAIGGCGADTIIGPEDGTTAYGNAGNDNIRGNNVEADWISCGAGTADQASCSAANGTYLACEWASYPYIPCP